MFVHPDNYALPGDNITSRINKMFEEAPLGSLCFIPAGITLTRTPGTNYYLRLRRDLNIFSNSTNRNPIFFDTSNGEADVLLIEPEAPNYVMLGLEIKGLFFNPIGVNLQTYNPATPNCNWCRDVVRINCRTGFGVTKMHLHNCYLPYGTGWALNLVGLDGEASINGSLFENLHIDGGIRMSKTGDALIFRNIRIDGKTGIEYDIQDGAGEYLFENIQNTPSYGPAVKGLGGNKVTFRQMYIEQKGWGSTTDKIVMDLRHSSLTGIELMNALTLDGISVLSQTGVAGNQLIRIGKSISPVLRRINFYGIDSMVNALKIDSDVSHPQLQGPFTFYGTFTNKIDCPNTTKPYGHAVGPAWWNAPLFTGATNDGNVFFTKSTDGTVTFSGKFVSSTPPTNGAGVCGIPAGMGAKKEVALTIMSDTGPCQLIISPDIGSGSVMSLEGLPPSATTFRGACVWHSKEHLDGVETPN